MRTRGQPTFEPVHRRGQSIRADATTRGLFKLLFIYFTIFISPILLRASTAALLQSLAGFANAIMEPEASSNASQIVGSNTENLYSVIDRDK